MFRNAIHLAIATLLLVPTLAQAQRSCPHERPHALALDLEGAETLSIELGRHTLRLTGAAGADGVVFGRACATSEKRLAELTLVQQREGTRLVLRAEDGGSGNVFRLFGTSDYAVHELNLRVPARLKVELGVGSGDAWVDSVAALDVSLGSGDVEVKQVAGSIGLTVGSGDAALESMARLTVSSVGSGDVTASAVGGELEIGSVGSGDIVVRGVAGSARIGSIGSGDVELSDVTGNVTVGSIGSGDLALDGVDGGVEVESLGSGDLQVSDIEGDVRLRRKGSGDVHPSNVRGEVSIVIQPRS